MSPGAIEDAIVSALQAVASRTYYNVSRFEGTAGALEDWMASVQVPAVAVFYAGGDFDTLDEQGQIEEGQITLQIWVVGDRLRGYATGMVEPGGIYDILDMIKTTLKGQSLGLAMTRLKRKTEGLMAMDAETGRILWTQTWETRVLG